MPCLFCQIVSKELSSEVVYENAGFLAFKDIHPIAPVHILIIPKKHIATLEDINQQDKGLIGELFLTAKKVAGVQKLSRSGYRLIFNVGENAGQAVAHIHLHLIGGKKLLWS